MKTSSTTGALAKALAAAQVEMRNPPLDGTNPHFKSRFSTLAAIREAVVPVLARHGISLTQDITSEPGGVACTTILMHESGEWAAYGPLVMPLGKDDAQARGSATTYCKRYAMQAVAAVVGDADDDAEATAGRSGDKRANPLGDPPVLSQRDEAHVRSLIGSFTDLLNADIEDAEKAEKMAALRTEANERQDLYVEVWRRLDSKQKAAIRKYLDLSNKRA